MMQRTRIASALLRHHQRRSARTAAIIIQTRFFNNSAWDLVAPTPSATPPASSNHNNTVSLAAEVEPATSSESSNLSLASSSLSLDGSDRPLTTSLHDWSRSFHGLSTSPFSHEIASVLLASISGADIEIKPDGLLYLPEIKYRRILNKAFGPGAWGLAPRGETNVGAKVVSREYGLVCLGRLVSVSRGEQEYFDPSGVPTATEGCKSNALMRCCKDLGIASELW